MFISVKESSKAFRFLFLLQVPLTALMHSPSLSREPILIKTKAGSLSSGPTTINDSSCVPSPFSRGKGLPSP